MRQLSITRAIDVMKKSIGIKPSTISEKRIVHRKGTTFMETYHIKPGEKLNVGHEVKFKPAGETYHRTGTIVRINKTTYTIEGKRNNAGEKQIQDVPHDQVVPVANWRQHRYAPSSKLDREKYTTKGNRSTAHLNLSDAESRRRKRVLEARLGGLKETDIVLNPSFEGPAVKIVSELATMNGIDTALSGKGKGFVWARAKSHEYQEMLSRYSIAALHAWRRELAKDMTPQVKENIEQFKAVITGKRKSSYVNAVMEREGKTAVINFLKDHKMHETADEAVDWNSSENVSPQAQKILDRTGSQPQHLQYTLAANKETLHDDIKRALNALAPVDRAVISAKFGFKPFAGPAVKNEDVANRLNYHGIRDDHRLWNRNTVGQRLKNIITKIRSMANLMKELSFHVDEALGRPVWKSARVPADWHPSGKFQAGGWEYEVIHHKGDAILTKAVRDGEESRLPTFELLVKSATKDLVSHMKQKAVNGCPNLVPSKRGNYEEKHKQFGNKRHQI